MSEKIPRQIVKPMIAVVFQPSDVHFGEEVEDTLPPKIPPIYERRLAGNSKKSFYVTPKQHDEHLVSSIDRNASHRKKEVEGRTDEEAEHPESNKKQKDAESKDYQIVTQLFLIGAVLVLLVMGIIVYQLSKDDKVFNTVTPYFTLILGYFFGSRRNKK